MGRSSARGQPDFDFSIPGDELEQHRIQLEHNLQHTDLSLHLSSDVHQDEDSLEYPRHLSGPSPFPEFASLEHLPREPDSQLHGWSYRTADDDEGISPYGGETLSTVAHHASGVTLSAGLGGRTTRRDASLSGAEYDPDRPLHAMIAGVDTRLSLFDIDPDSKSRVAASIGFDPLVVDNTDELDRVLQSGHSLAPASSAVRLRSAHSSASSSASDSDAGSQLDTSRPKLSDALRRVSFSPKRPRSPLPHRQLHSNSADSHRGQAGRDSINSFNFPASSTSQRHASSPLVQQRILDEDDVPTPKPPRSKRNIFPSYTSSQPEVRLQPPTPSTAGSKFTKMARGLAREIGDEQSRWDADGGHDYSVQDEARSRTSERNPFHDIVNQPQAKATAIRQPTPRPMSAKSPRGRVHLPDVTGLTSAVESPAKPGQMYYPLDEDVIHAGEERLLAVITEVQTKLHHLESENSISRRRVRELELELEACKEEVARERTRVLEREEVIVQQQHDVERARASAARKGKAKANAQAQVSMLDDRSTDRYREVVEEKKALEALISTLRSHLTRLTSELSSHQELLTELRTLRESDSRALKEKSAEVDRLRNEVERLAGEVEVLRGVVEEGLKERRMVREQTESSQSDHAEEADGTHNSKENTAEENDHQDMGPDPEGSFNMQSPEVSSAPWQRPDKTMRTDHATLGSSNMPDMTQSRPFIEDEELERISAEVEERRSNRSASILSQSQSRSQSQSQSHSRSLLQPGSRPASPYASSVRSRDESRLAQARAPSPAASSRPPSVRPPSAQDATRKVSRSSPPPVDRPVAPTPQASRADGRRSHAANPSAVPADVETPFPQIRGGHLERLFFSAPEHNAKTCTVCHRRRLPGTSSHGHEPTPSWLPERPGRNFRATVEDASDSDNDDEGFAEGPDEAEPVIRNTKGKGKELQWAALPQAAASGLPPQTVLARVLRELEDDFTHYKSIYVELADQYKYLDAASDVRKRNLLARHLREVIDILEQKGDQIASLYELLTYKDKPVSESAVQTASAAASSSWGRSRGQRLRQPS